MPRFIFKITDPRDSKDYYGEWSTVVDAPVTMGMSLSKFKEYYKVQYGTSMFTGLSERLERVEEKGTSSFFDENVDTLFSSFWLNRESKLTMEELKRSIIDGIEPE